MAKRTERADRPLVASMSDLGGVGRLLHRDGRRRDRRPAVDAHRLDRHLRREVRHRRTLRQARRAHRLDERRPARRNRLAGSPVHAGGGQEAAGAAAGVLRPVHREGRRLTAQDAGGDRPYRAGARVDRAAGARERLWSTRSAVSIARSRWPRSARRLAPTSPSNWWCSRRVGAFYEAAQRAVVGRRPMEQAAVSRWFASELNASEREALRAPPGTIRHVSAGRDADADAVHAIAVVRGWAERAQGVGAMRRARAGFRRDSPGSSSSAWP